MPGRGALAMRELPGILKPGGPEANHSHGIGWERRGIAQVIFGAAELESHCLPPWVSRTVITILPFDCLASTTRTSSLLPADMTAEFGWPSRRFFWELGYQGTNLRYNPEASRNPRAASGLQRLPQDKNKTAITVSIVSI